MLVKSWLGNDNTLGIDIWDRKYRFNNESLDEWFARVSGGNKDVEQIIKDKKFLYAGRILSNRGLNKLGKKVTLSNCYVITPPEDNIESIFTAASRLARTYSYGGGCGIDISKLAPRGAQVNNAAKMTTGAVSFMDLYSLVTGMIGQNGRRGALMISIDCNHPDLEEFIDVKNDLTRVTKANVSVRLTDAFMKAVKENTDYNLEFHRPEVGQTITKTVNARNIFMKLAKNNWSMAEPGCLFWDTINEWNMLSETEEFEFAGVNPCSEEPLNAGGSCLLGSINLSAFVMNPFTADAYFDFDDFARTVEIGVIGLNETLDEGLPLHPLEEQREAVRDWRQIGLGMMGLADLFIKLGMRYGSEESLQMAKKISSLMADTAIRTSALLAKDTGAYPKCDIDAILRTKFLQANASNETQELVKKYGLKNSQVLTVAPTGSIGSMLGISTGIEPIFANSYTRKTETLHAKDTYYKVYTPIVEQYMKKNNIEKEEDLPDFFVTSGSLNYIERIDIQAVWQYAIDASISSTVNVPEEFSVEDTFNLYMYAWEQGLKGITIFRENCDRMGILTTENTKQKEEHVHEEQEESKRTCPECGEELSSSGGCVTCHNCGWAVCE
jgi:ribonucleoside-diphosphate reductase alpha chain